MACLVLQVVKNPPAMQETRVQVLGSGRSPGGGHGNPVQHSCLEHPMDRGYHPRGRKELDTTEPLMQQTLPLR